MTSLAHLQSDLTGYLLCSAEHGDGYLVAGFMGAQHVCEVVEVINLLLIKFNQDVTSFQSCLGGGAAVPHVRELHAMFYLGEIRNGTKIRTITTSAAYPRVGRFGH